MAGSLLQIPLSRESIVTSEIRLRLFQQGDADAFRELNEAWIARYFRLEEQDRIQLGDPESRIIRVGGQIVMAVAGEMAVSEDYRGHGIGRKLLEYTIAQAKAIGAHTLELASNSKLANAVHLYESMGFRHLPPERVEPSPYARANVFMEMHLSPVE